MKLFSYLVIGALALMLSTNDVMAQPGGQDGDRPGRGRPGAERQGGQHGQHGQPGRQGGQRTRGGPGGGSPPLMAILDKDGDGSLSAKEIENAAAMIKKLDKDGDGKVTMREVFAARGGGRNRGGAGRPGGEGRPGEGRPGAGRPGGEGGRPGAGGEGGRPGGAGRMDVVARLKEMDKNGDGKLSKDEIPERMAQFLSRADTNEDGELDAAELKAIAERVRQRGGAGGRSGDGGGRAGGRRGDGGGAGGGRGGEGGRPQRPKKDDK